MLRKITLLAMAVGALVAFAVPASASATEWTAEEAPFSGHTTIEAEGHAEFKVTGAVPTGVTCEEALFTLTLKGGSDEGWVTAFSVTSPITKCSGFGNLAPCEPVQPDPENMVTGWPVTATANGTIDITGIQFKATYNNCAASQIAGGSITLTPNNRNAIETLSGSGTAFGNVHLNADLTVLAPHTGVIGIS
jgi:hypothetical protein